MFREPKGLEHRSVHASLCLGLLCLASLAGCASNDAPVAPSRDARPAPSVTRYLLQPLDGYSLTVGTEATLRLERGHKALVDRGDASAALAIARDLLSRDDELLPAMLLESQVDFVAGNYESVVRRLEGSLTPSSTYTAARLLLGRSHDLLGAESDAFSAYRGLDGSELAASRAGALLPKVIDELAIQLQSALDDGATDQAASIAERIELYSPGSISALVAARDVASATGDLVGELAHRRALAGFESPNLDDRRRMGELEVEVGDPTQGVEILQQLVNAAPDDYDLREALESAKFNWRLNMLPPAVVSVVRSDELKRSDFATLLYWVVPGARSGSAQTAVIASDVPLDHPQRSEVVRVLNLGLMPMADAALRRFAPDQSVSMSSALDVLLRIPASRGMTPACTRSYEQKRRPSASDTCEAAVRCGIAASREACAVEGSVSGAQAREFVRRTLNLLGGSTP